MATFALTLVHGPGWDDTRPIRGQRSWPEHAAFMDELVTDGFLIIGGPLDDGQESLHAIEAASEQDVVSRMAQDPWATLGMLRIGSIRPWALWLDSREKRFRPG